MEKLKVDKQKSIINQLVNELAAESPDLYYTDSSTISSLIYERIHSANQLSRENLEVVEDLSADDILILLSYKSNCC
jgi:hypothetical protein